MGALICKKVTFDKYNNIDITIKYQDYDIRVTSTFSNSPEAIEELLLEYCVVYMHKSYIAHYRTKAVIERTIYFNRKYFVINNPINIVKVIEIIAGKTNTYNININISKYKVGLASIYDDVIHNICTEDDYDVERVNTNSSQTAIKTEINALIKKAFTYAKLSERNYFNVPKLAVSGTAIRRARPNRGR